MAAHMRPAVTRVRRRNVKPGDVLITSLPFSFVLKSTLLGCCCSFCLEKCSSLMRCSGCHLLRFCSAKCHKHAWKQFHRLECRKLLRLSDRVIPDSALLLARIINKLNHGGDQEYEWVTETRRRSFKDLMSHYSDLKSSGDRLQHVQSLEVVLRSLVDPVSIPNTAELMGIYGRMCINCFNMLDAEMSPVGVAVYLAPSVVDHSCWPNAVATFSGRSLQIRAIEQIDNFCWSKVRISYIDMLADRQSRRDELSLGYFFLCNCSRCSSQQFLSRERTRVCDNGDCSAAIVVPDGNQCDNSDASRLTCDECDHVTLLDERERRRFDAVIDESRSMIKQGLKSTLYYEHCSLCLDRLQECRVHPLNLLSVKMLDLTFETALSAQMWQQALEMGQKLLPGYRLYYGEFHPLFGLLLLKLAKMALYLLQHKMAAGWLREASRVLRVSHGSDHRLITVELRSLCQQLTDETALNL